MLPSVFIWRSDVKDIWNIWKSDWSLKEQATLRWCVDGNPGLGWELRSQEMHKHMEKSIASRWINDCNWKEKGKSEYESETVPSSGS